MSTSLRGQGCSVAGAALPTQPKTWQEADPDPPVRRRTPASYPRTRGHPPAESTRSRGEDRVTRGGGGGWCIPPALLCPVMASGRGRGASRVMARGKHHGGDSPQGLKVRSGAGGRPSERRVSFRPADRCGERTLADAEHQGSRRQGPWEQLVGRGRAGPVRLKCQQACAHRGLAVGTREADLPG